MLSLPSGVHCSAPMNMVVGIHIDALALHTNGMVGIGKMDVLQLDP